MRRSTLFISCIFSLPSFFLSHSSHQLISLSNFNFNLDIYSPTDDRAAAQKALQTVAAGQQAENLLDFDDEPSSLSSLSSLDGGANATGLAATQVPAAAAATSNLLAGTSSNPLDDLVSIFGSSGIGSGSGPTVETNGLGGGGMGGMGGLGGMGVMSPISPQQTNGVVSPSTGQGQGAQEDLLGLF